MTAKEDSLFWKNRGDNYVIREEYTHAISSYEYALHLDGNNLAAWNNLGCALHKAGKTEEAHRVKHTLEDLKQKMMQEQKASRASVFTSDILLFFCISGHGMDHPAWILGVPLGRSGSRNGFCMGRNSVIHHRGMDLGLLPSLGYGTCCLQVFRPADNRFHWRRHHRHQQRCLPEDHTVRVMNRGPKECLPENEPGIDRSLRQFPLESSRLSSGSAVT